MKMQLIKKNPIPLKKCFTPLWLSSVRLSSTAAVFQMKLLCFPPFVLSTFGSSYCKLFSALFLIHFRWKHRMKKNPWKSMVFCYQNCSDLLWEKNVLVIKENFWNSRLRLRSLEQFIRTKIITQIQKKNNFRTVFDLN